eukprot:7282995-Alexandrium_andersonii.AAC.1
MRVPRPKPYGVPPKPSSAGSPAEGGEKKGAPLLGTPPRKSPKPKPTPAPADGGEEAKAKAEATAVESAKATPAGAPADDVGGA